MQTEHNNQTITGPELTEYLSGVVRVRCGDYQDSGVLWFNNGIYSVLTNQHVTSSLEYNQSCVVIIEEKSKKGLSTVYETVALKNSYQWNNKADIIVLQLIERGSSQHEERNYIPVLKRQTAPLKNLNFKISLIPKCKANMPLGSPAMVVGYPASTIKKINTEKWIFFESSQTITEGIISALDDSVNGFLSDQLYPNYFVSSKIDSGNSGGVAFSKNNGKLCLLGIPTWLNIGDYDTQGIIQNIYNIISK